MPEREKMQEAYYRIAADPATLADYNDVRLGCYDNQGRRLFVIVDNVDNYDEDEQMLIFEFITRTLLGHEAVRVVVPLRPTSQLLINRMGQGLDIISTGIDLHSPSPKHLLERMCSRSINGRELSLDNELPGATITWRKLLDEYLISDSAALLRDLCSSEPDIPPPTYKYRAAVKRRRYDCRHYIRLFRRLLMSDTLRTYSNICSEYYAVQALMLHAGEPMLPQSAFMLNLFDNDLPDNAGNALVRYRVLEYFHTNTDIGPLFDAYFRALLSSPRVARDVLDVFTGAGLIRPDFVVDSVSQKQVMRSAKVTCAGRRHYAVVRNLWYGICAKTGMHVEPTMIKRGDDAQQAARDEAGIESRSLLDFYGSNGWVSDKEFIEFLYKQEDLEARRIGEFQENEPGLLPQVAGLLENRSSAADILSQEYGEQMENWRRKGRTVQ